MFQIIKFKKLINFTLLKKNSDHQKIALTGIHWWSVLSLLGPKFHHS